MTPDQLAQAVSGIVSTLAAEGRLSVPSVPEVKIERPKSRDHGDYATNVALALANHLATELWLLRVITSGRVMTRNEMIAATLVRLLVLTVATLVLMVAVPLLMHLVFTARLFTPGFADAYASARLLMLLCMPQVFFYGTLVLLGQVLNARGVFGPMMWAPIAACTATSNICRGMSSRIFCARSRPRCWAAKRPSAPRITTYGSVPSSTMSRRESS